MSELAEKSINNLSDDELIDLILKADRPELFEVIYDRYATKIFQKCLSFTKDESEAKDVAHDVIIKIYVSLSKFGGRSKFSTWIYAITYNYCVDYQAKKMKKMSLTDELNAGVAEAEVEEPDEKELMSISMETLQMLLEKLTPAEKSILLMKYQDEMSIKDISELTKSGESAVKMKLKRTKAKLLKLHAEAR